MSYHILTLSTAGVRLSVQHGFLVCTYPATGEEKRLPLADVRAVVVGTPHSSFTSECLARLLANQSVVLHCNKHFAPVGWSVPLEQTVRSLAFLNQIHPPQQGFDKALWHQLLWHKAHNQASCLQLAGAPAEAVLQRLGKPVLDEANIARTYWPLYFEALGQRQKREHQGAETFENKALNYGYAVYSTLVYRSLLIHGLCPQLGVHHVLRAKAHPLVYDVLEPLRPFVDYTLWHYLQQGSAKAAGANEEALWQGWVAHLMQSLQTLRLQEGPKATLTFKVMDYVDRYVNSVARAFEHQTLRRLHVPLLAHTVLGGEAPSYGQEPAPTAAQLWGEDSDDGDENDTLANLDPSLGQFYLQAQGPTGQGVLHMSRF
jgi:CRISPR-associated protein Cas1